MLATSSARIRRRPTAASTAGARRWTALSRPLAVAIAVSAAGVLIAAPSLRVGVDAEIILLAVSFAAMAFVHAQSMSLERELRQARVRAVDAIDIERRRIQRDLHDSAQQRLVCVRISLGLLARRVVPESDRAAIEAMGRDIDAALADIRSVTLDSGPLLLAERGVAESLRSASAHAPLRVSIETRRFGRYSPSIERAIYFSCLEALQNVFKHAGSKAAARVRLRDEPDLVRFDVEDSGVGFDPARVHPGLGLLNVRDRITVMGGHLTIDSRPGLGTRISGEIPVSDRDRAMAA